jgi:hypothetical protein
MLVNGTLQSIRYGVAAGQFILGKATGVYVLISSPFHNVILYKRSMQAKKEIKMQKTLVG